MVAHAHDPLTRTLVGDAGFCGRCGGANRADVALSCASPGYDCTPDDSFRKEVLLDGRLCRLDVLDGPTHPEALYTLHRRDVAVIVYSVASRASFHAVEMWHGSVGRVLAKAPQRRVFPWVLVGNMSDLMDAREVGALEGKVSEGATK